MPARLWQRRLVTRSTSTYALGETWNCGLLEWMWHMGKKKEKRKSLLLSPLRLGHYAKHYFFRYEDEDLGPDVIQVDSYAWQAPHASEGLKTRMSFLHHGPSALTSKYGGPTSNCSESVPNHTDVADTISWKSSGSEEW